MKERVSTIYLKVFMGLMFFIIGLSKFFYFKAYTALIPFGSLSIYAAIIVMAIEIICGFGLMMSWKVKYTSISLIFVLIGVLIFVIFPSDNVINGLLNPLVLSTIFLHLLAVGVLLSFVVDKK